MQKFLRNHHMLKNTIVGCELQKVELYNNNSNCDK